MATPTTHIYINETLRDAAKNVGKKWSAAQVRVRIWQPPDLDTTNLTKPVRFWELIELRPTTAGGKPVTPSRRDTDSTVAVPSATTKFTVTTSTSSSITSSTATSTAPVTVPWQPQTTVDPCGETDPSALMETLKAYRSSKLVRFVMTGDDAPDPPKEAERTWWDEDEWKRGGRSVLSPDVSRLHRRKELQMTVRNAMRELERLDHEDVDSERAEKPPEQEDRRIPDLTSSLPVLCGRIHFFHHEEDGGVHRFG
ncbi:unnamed protein product [Nippostrongylus brasiliensis]|uniref:Pyridox_oxase_2 domain-containing protein n=1 Tax=Nippostrongylus brasiliensis TaxID=27835 RepID=A0A158QY72_NIPBR|nr:unnamed protein product [Nippostrongylus brasiliensis]